MVIGIGPYSEDLIEHLPYGRREYRGTNPGKKVVHPFILEAIGSTQSNELAALLGIRVWDFNQHELDLSKVNWNDLITYDKVGAELLTVLSQHGFTFYFLPNG